MRAWPMLALVPMLALPATARPQVAPADLSQPDAARQLAAKMKRARRPIDVLVNCAGVADAAKTVSKGEPFPLATWNKVIGINLTGTFNDISIHDADTLGKVGQVKLPGGDMSLGTGQVFVR